MGMNKKDIEECVIPKIRLKPHIFRNILMYSLD